MYKIKQRHKKERSHLPNIHFIFYDFTYRAFLLLFQLLLHRDSERQRCQGPHTTQVNDTITQGHYRHGPGIQKQRCQGLYTTQSVSLQGYYRHGLGIQKHNAVRACTQLSQWYHYRVTTDMARGFRNTTLSWSVHSLTELSMIPLQGY